MNNRDNIDLKKKKNLIGINSIIIVCTAISIIVFVSFLFVLFGNASFIASVKNTVNESIISLVELYNNNSSTNQMLSIDELREAQNYISEAREFFTVASSNTVISIIYAFATTVILTIGAFVVGRLTKKSDDIYNQLREFETSSSDLNKKMIDMNKQLSDNENTMHILQKTSSILLEFQNIISNTIYATILLRECENNLHSHSDSFILLNSISNRLMMIPHEYRVVPIDQIEDSFTQIESSELKKSLVLNLTGFSNNYKSVVKHFLDYYQDIGDFKKLSYKELKCNSIEEILDDINSKLNNGFFCFKD